MTAAVIPRRCTAPTDRTGRAGPRAPRSRRSSPRAPNAGGRTDRQGRRAGRRRSSRRRGGPSPRRRSQPATPSAALGGSTPCARRTSSLSVNVRDHASRSRTTTWRTCSRVITSTRSAPSVVRISRSRTRGRWPLRSIPTLGRCRHRVRCPSRVHAAGFPRRSRSRSRRRRRARPRGRGGTAARRWASGTRWRCRRRARRRVTGDPTQSEGTRSTRGCSQVTTRLGSSTNPVTWTSIVVVAPAGIVDEAAVGLPSVVLTRLKLGRLPVDRRRCRGRGGCRR